MEYSYTRRDLLAEPQAYMYPPFGGWDFLVAYRKSRLACLAPILDHLEAGHPRGIPFVRGVESTLAQGGVMQETDHAAILGELLGIWPPADGEIAPVPEDRLETAAMLRQRLRHPEAFADLKTDVTLRGLARRFEVSKKLPRRLVAPRYSLGDDPLLEVTPYAHFAALLGLAGWDGRDLRVLNCLLKVDDLLCSQPRKTLCEPDAAPFLALAVLHELSLTGDLRPR